MSKPRRWRLLPTRCRARSPLGAPAPSSWAHRLLPGLLAGIASTQNAGHHEKADHEPPPCGTLSFESECAHGRAERGRLRCWIQEETDFGWRQAAGCSRGTCARAASRLGEGDALQGRCSRVHGEESQLPARGASRNMTTDSIATLPFGAASRAALARQAELRATFASLGGTSSGRHNFGGKGVTEKGWLTRKTWASTRYDVP